MSATENLHVYPHVYSNQEECESCHFIDERNTALLPDWAFQAPQNIDDTPYNNLCRHCHNDIEAPLVSTHSSLTTDGGYGTWSMECRTCHDPHRYRQFLSYRSAAFLSSGVVSSVSDNALVAAGMSWTDNQYRGFVVVPNTASGRDAHKILSNTSNTLLVEGPMDLGLVAPGNTFGIIWGKLVRSVVRTPTQADRKVRFFRETGTNSFADGDGTIDGICQVCHTQTSCHKASGTDAGSHNAGTKCMVCHPHEGGFKGAGGSGSHEGHTAFTTCEGGTTGCHGANLPPLLSDGQNLQNTTVCNTCHSPGGTYDGVNDPVIGCKANWTGGSSQVYDGENFVAGKEKWCAGCHDESPSVVLGVSAPSVIGDEDGAFAYGAGWGYYKTGHGLASGFYPASGSPPANLKCTACHDRTATHIDGNQRTYSASSANYQAGYRLKRPMDVPRSDQGEPVSDFQLCLDCHASSPFLVSSDTTTNFRNGTTNEHWMHLQAPPTGMWAGGGWWDSDWNGTGDSKISCPACHNVHGSASPRMLRRGELISTPGTTDKVPAINFRYTPYSPVPYPTLSASAGGQLNPSSAGGGTVANTGICSMCHANNVSYTRTPSDPAPYIVGVYGKAGSNLLSVVFSEGVYTNAGASGGLVSGDFAFTDLDNGRTVLGATHTAGESAAVVALSSALDASNDIGTDTLAAAAASIYDGASNPMGTTAVAVAGDTSPPTVADRSPANGATGVGIQSNVAMSLLDSQSGVDWTSFSITLSGDKGYSRTYTDLDVSVVSRTGSPTGYSVTVNPDADFSYGEVVTVTVNASDLVGNAMTPAVWTFTTVSGGAPLTMTLHPSGVNFAGSFTVTGGTWADALDGDDGDTSFAGLPSGSAYPVNTNSRFIVDMDDPSGISGATIQNFTVHVLARYTAGGGNPPPPQTGTMQVCYTTDGTNNVCSGTFTLPAVASYGDYAMATATTDSAGGPLDLADINNLRVEVRRLTSGGYWLRVTEVKVELTYVP
jgi:hypothetical protein